MSHQPLHVNAATCSLSASLDKLAQLEDELGQLLARGRAVLDEVQGAVVECEESVNRLREVLDEQHHLLLHVGNVLQAAPQGLADGQVGMVQTGGTNARMESNQLRQLRPDLLSLRAEALKIRSMIHHAETLAEIDDMRRETAEMQLSSQEVQQLIARVADRFSQKEARA